MATLQDIADRLNISKGTVSKALNGAPDISETLQKTILETAVEMGYTKIRRQKAVPKKLCNTKNHINSATRLFSDSASLRSPPDMW